MTKGIDVSKHQGVIDWEKVNADGYGFAMIRAGWTWYDGGFDADAMLEENVTGAAAAGLAVGVYAYSYDLTPEAAKTGAQAFLKAIAPYRLTMPVVFDLEPDEARSRKKGRELNPVEAQAIATVALEEIEAAGYYAMLYSCESWFKTHLAGLERYDWWIAKWSSAQPAYSHGIWQYSSTGRVDGISTDVDLNCAYKDYPAIIRGAGLNGWGVQTPESGAELKARIAELEADNAALQAQLATADVQLQRKETENNELKILLHEIQELAAKA